MFGNLGVSYYEISEYEKAIDAFNQALTLSRDTKNRHQEGIVLGYLGVAYGLLRQFEKALDYHTQALAIHRELQDHDRRGDPRLPMSVSSTTTTAIYTRPSSNTSRRSRSNGTFTTVRAEGQTLNSLGASYASLSQYERRFPTMNRRWRWTGSWERARRRSAAL